MLRIEDLHKSFDDFKAVNGVHLTVEKGQLVAVIGPNGIGKSTLLKVLMGELEIRAVTERDAPAVLESFHAVFAPAGERLRDLDQWRWAYLDNPAGRRAWAAFDGDRVAAHYAALPASALRPRLTAVADAAPTRGETKTERRAAGENRTGPR